MASNWWQDGDCQLMLDRRYDMLQSEFSLVDAKSDLRKSLALKEMHKSAGIVLSHWQSSSTGKIIHQHISKTTASS
uniref:Uncharacterized protein n=1 Tax=Arundo donax TaxID=35708 RepID=A0A0A9DD67_ARUDO